MVSIAGSSFKRKQTEVFLSGIELHCLPLGYITTRTPLSILNLCLMSHALIYQFWRCHYVVKKFYTFYRTEICIAMFTEALHLALN
jgi:hypothetical protein